MVLFADLEAVRRVAEEEVEDPAVEEEGFAVEEEEQVFNARKTSRLPTS